MLHYLGLAGAYFAGWYLFWRLKLNKPVGPFLAFHDVCDELDLSITRLSPQKFNNIIEYLYSCGMRGVSISDLENKNDIALTFDDGWQNFYTNVFPTLQKYGFSATIFIIAGYVGEESNWDYKKKKHLSWEEIRSLAKEGIEIASHSINHLDLRGLDDRQLEHEVSDSKNIIEDKLGLPVKYFSYPFGRYNRKIIEAVKSAGYENAFALSGDNDDFALARRAVYLYDTPYSINLKLHKNLWLEGCKDYINNSLAGGTITLRKLFPIKDSK